MPSLREPGVGGLIVKGWRPARPLLLGGALCALASPAVPQALDPGQGPGGVALSATLTQRVEADSNFSLDDPSPGASYFGDTRLGLGLVAQMRTGALALGFDTGVRAFFPPDEDFDLAVASPTTASAGYVREWASGSLETELRYRQTRVDFDRPLDDLLGVDPVTGAPLPAGAGDPDLDEAGDPLIGDEFGELPDDLDDLDGETIERRYDADVTLALAQDAPSTYEFTLDATRYEYSEEATDRVPRTSLRGSAAWSLRLTPVLSSVVALRGYGFDAENATETRIRETELDAGVIYAASDVLRLTAGLGYVDRTREQTRADGTRITVEDGTGPALRAGLRYDLPAFRLDADTRVFAADPDTRVSGNLRVSYPLLRSRVNARAFRRHLGNSSGDEVRLTGASIGIERELNRVSRLGLDFSAANQVAEDADDPDVRRFDASATLSRDITETVSADLGYRFRNRDEGPENATSHAVFFQIGRSFESRF